MCRTPLTARRSEAFTIIKRGTGQGGGQEDRTAAGRGGLAGGKKELGSYGIWRILQNFLEHPATLLRKARGRAGIG